MTSIEGLGKKFQEARLARGLTLDEAARMTKIRPSRLAEIEGDDFSQFPSLAYAKGFLLIYGKFLDVDVTPYMEAFEGSDAGVTVDGYSYLQDNPAPAPVRAPIVRRRPARVHAPSAPSSGRPSIMPLLLVPAIIIVGFLAMKLILTLQRLGPQHVGEPQPAEATATAAPSAVAVVPSATLATPTAQAAASVAPTVVASAAPVVPSPTVAPSATAVVAASTPPAPPPKPSASAIAKALESPPAKPAASAKKGEPEVRRAEPVKPEDLANVTTSVATTAAAPTATPASPATAASAAPETAGGPNRVTIRPLKKTYVRVVVDDEASTPAYERWLSPSDQAVEFRGQHINIKVLERGSLEIKKNGKPVSASGDDDVTLE